jgi:hypothetical protein
MSWHVFISHASEDKKSVAEPLARALSQAGLSVWYDRFQLHLGDRLLRTINDGLRQSRFGVVILSPSFFSKHWPQLELDGLAQREAGGRKVILPVWHEVTLEDVRERSPLLADRVAVKWSDGLTIVVKEILAVVNALDDGEDANENMVIGALLRIKQQTRFLWQEFRNHVNDDSQFSAKIRSDTLKAIEPDLAALRDHVGLAYEVRYLSSDFKLGDDVNEIRITRTTPALWRAIVKTLAFDR